MLRNLLFSLTAGLSILFVTVLIAAYGKGYRLDLAKKTVGATGLLVATSTPNGAQIFADNRLISATNTTVSLPPGWYNLKIVKDGYQSWQKTLKVQGEIVTKADATLFPVNPELKPLTQFGATTPTLSPDGSKIAFIVPKDKFATSSSEVSPKAGIWVLNLNDSPIVFRHEAKQIAVTSSSYDFSLCSFTWSSDSKQILCQGTTSSYLLDSDRLNDPPPLIVNTSNLLSSWEEDETLRQSTLLKLFPDAVSQIATQSARDLSFSPDENRLLYTATASAVIPQIIKPPLIGTNSTKEERNIIKGGIYVYDLKEDKNYRVADAPELEQTSPTPKINAIQAIKTAQNASALLPVSWFPDSHHLLSVTKESISIMESDGTNRTAVYTGSFEGGFVFPWPNGSQLVIVTNYNRSADHLANLYAINLR